MKIKLTEAAEVIRSKNSGPFELTFDFMFKSRPDAERVYKTGFFSSQNICRLLKIQESELIDLVWFAPANALKITIKRPYPSGALGERDVYGAQQAAPFMDVVLELEET